jgi:voltage-gated potassium channel Kch
MAARRLWLAFVIFICILLVGTFVYHEIEGLSYVDSLYFTTVTVTTVGYGDFVPLTTNGKIFTIFFSISGIGLALYTLTVFGKYLITMRRRSLKEEGYIKLRRRRKK